jgi:hypothetical protein
MIHHDLVEARVVPDESGKSVVYAHLSTHFRLRGDTEEVVAPRFFVITVGEAAGIYEGTDGLQIYDVRLFWDTGILARFVTERKKRGFDIKEENTQANNFHLEDWTRGLAKIEVCDIGVFEGSILWGEKEKNTVEDWCTGSW